MRDAGETDDAGFFLQTDAYNAAPSISMTGTRRPRSGVRPLRYVVYPVHRTDSWARIQATGRGPLALDKRRDCPAAPAGLFEAPYTGPCDRLEAFHPCLGLCTGREHLFDVSHPVHGSRSPANRAGRGSPCVGYETSLANCADCSHRECYVRVIPECSARPEAR